MSLTTVRIDDNRIMIPAGSVAGMAVPGIIYVSRELEQLLEEKAIRQVANVASLPGIVTASLAMPDIHTGYGFPIGGVAAFDADEGVVSPGGVGYDINCGVRLLRTGLVRDELAPVMERLVAWLFANVPTGVGSKGRIGLSAHDERAVSLRGAAWSVAAGYGDRDDLDHVESGGALPCHDPDAVSRRAYERGRQQQGTLGSGNHFLEIQYVAEVFDPARAGAFGLFPGQVAVMIHTGSRGLGHQVCTDYVETMLKASARYGIALNDRELACAPVGSPEARRYLDAMNAAANYAWANRQCLTHWVREGFSTVLGCPAAKLGMDVVYDVAHNIAKFEEHVIDGNARRLLVHRKGATRAFGPGHQELPAAYRDSGQPVIIPGDMGRASFVLAGTGRAMHESFGSTCHGAGRVMSRHQAIRAAKGRDIRSELARRGVVVMSAGRETLAEEMPDAYKDVSSVVGVVADAGLSTFVARLQPLGVVKG